MVTVGFKGLNLKSHKTTRGNYYMSLPLETAVHNAPSLPICLSVHLVPPVKTKLREKAAHVTCDSGQYGGQKSKVTRPVMPKDELSRNFWMKGYIQVTSIVTKVRSASARLFAGMWHPLVSVITTPYYVAKIILDRRVWHHTLSVRYTCIQSSDIILIP